MSITFDNFVVVQTQDPCITGLGPKVPAPANPVALGFNAVTPQPAGDWTTFMANPYDSICPITSCTLYAPGCLIPYLTYTPGGRLTVSSVSPFTISVVSD